MMKSSLAAYNLIGMEFSADTDTRRQVYVNFRQIFEQEKRKGVGLEKGRIKTLVKTRESMQPLRARMGQQKLLSLLRSMVDEGIFDSELRAWQEFPELFPARPPGDSVVDLQHVAVAEGCKERGEDGSVDDLTDDELGETMPASTKDAAIQHGTISALLPDSTGAVTLSDPAKNTAVAPAVGQGGDAWTTGPLAFPDQRLPYGAQHAVLLAVQRMLEEACFGFAQKCLPTVLQRARFDCPVAVELTKWVKILTKHRDELGATVAPGLKTPSFPALMGSMRMLRHTAVHRIPVSTAVLCQLVGSAADLTEALQDNARADLMRDMGRTVETSLEETKQVLRENVDRELEEIRRAREELNRREKDIFAKAFAEDAERRRELGQRLEQAVNHAIAEWDARMAKGLSGTSRVEAVPSAPLDSPASVAGVEAGTKHHESVTSLLGLPKVHAAS